MSISERGLQLAVWMRTRAYVDPDDRDRGDVPGWVLVTLMTAALVTAIWVVAEDQLVEILEDALDSVTPE